MRWKNCIAWQGSFCFKECGFKQADKTEGLKKHYYMESYLCEKTCYDLKFNKRYFSGIWNKEANSTVIWDTSHTLCLMSWLFKFLQRKETWNVRTKT